MASCGAGDGTKEWEWPLSVLYPCDTDNISFELCLGFILFFLVMKIYSFK